jgi:hypothetical protein
LPGIPGNFTTELADSSGIYTTKARISFNAQNHSSHEQPDTTQTPNAGAGRAKPRSHRRQGCRKSESRREGAGTQGQATAQVPQLRPGGAEGQGWEVHCLRSGAKPPKQEKAKKDLRGMRGVVFSGVSNSNRNQK